MADVGAERVFWSQGNARATELVVLVGNVDDSWALPEEW